VRILLRLTLSFAVAVGLPGLSLADDSPLLADYSLTTWNHKDGLPRGAVRALAQDSSGMLWIGTSAGLYRSDGAQMVAWNALSRMQLPTALVRALAVEPSGTLWVGYADVPALFSIHGEHAKEYTAADGFDGTSVQFVKADPLGAMWLGTSRGLYRLDSGHWNRIALPSAGDVTVYCGLFKDDGSITVGTARGIFRRAAGAAAFEVLELFERPVLFRMDSVPLSLAEDTDGKLLVTDDVNGYRMVGGQLTRPVDEVRARGRDLMRDREGAIWLGTGGQGVWRIRQDSRGRRIVDRISALNGLLADGAMTVLEDRDGNIWIGTSEGLNELTPYRVRQLTRFGPVLGVERGSDHSIWLATNDDLIQYPHGDELLSPTVVHSPYGRIRAIHADRHDSMWVATEQGLFRFNPQSQAFSRLPGLLKPTRVRAITADQEHGVWVYDAIQGLLHVDSDGYESFSSSLVGPQSPVDIASMFTDRAGVLWIGLSDGRVVTMRRHQGIDVVGDPGGLMAGSVNAFYEDDDGSVWIVCEKGLAHFQNGKITVVHSSADSLPSGLTSVVKDEIGRLWIGSGRGVHPLYPREFEAAAVSSAPKKIRIVTRADGLAGLPLRYSLNRRTVRASDGRLWFITGRGVSIIDPSTIPTADQPPTIRLDTATVNDALLPIRGSEELPPGINRLVINYSAVDFRAPFSLHFRYRLDGFDTSWVDAGLRRQATYTNLPAGSFIFHAMVDSDEETWDETETVWRFTIHPHWYQTNTFYAASALAGVLLVVGSVQLRNRQMRRHFDSLLAERIRLSRDIHDTLLQSFVYLVLEVDCIAHEPPIVQAGMQPRFLKLRRQLEGYVREARESILQLRSLGGSTACPFEVALSQATDAVTNDNAVPIQFNVRGLSRPIDPTIRREAMFIVREAVSNALRHAAPGTVQVDVNYQDRDVIIAVADDGCGFDLSQDPGSEHFGLTTMKERAAGIGARFSVVSSLSGGTTVSLIIPPS
jgi:ligand-binding sensor domain-containing protein/signal transduction histidine kinase